MNTSFAIASLLFSISPSFARADCGGDLSRQITTADAFVQSLRPDKPSEAKLMASDGSVFSASEVLWMKGQIRSVMDACRRSEESVAGKTLREVTSLIDSRQRKIRI